MGVSNSPSVFMIKGNLERVWSITAMFLSSWINIMCYNKTYLLISSSCKAKRFVYCLNVDCSSYLTSRKSVFKINLLSHKQNHKSKINIKKVKKGTYDKFRGYADNVFVVKGGFTTTDSKTCVTSGTQDSTYGDFRAAAIRTAGNKANVTITNKNFGSSTYHYTDANGNLIELIDTSGNRITSDNDADRIRVTYSLPTSMTLKETDSIDIKMLMKSTTSIRATYATSDGAGKYNCTAIGMRAPIFTMTVTQTPMQ